MKLASLIVALLLAPPLAAQPPGSAGQADEEFEAAERAAQERFQQAVEQLGAGELEAAAKTLEPLADDPHTPPPVRALLGSLYLQMDRATEALELLAPLAQQPDADPAVLYNAGRAALAVGRVDQGAALLERSVALEPGTPAARELGLLRGSQGRLADALRLLTPWVRQNPQDLDARLATAHAALGLERVPEAEGLLSDLPQTDPRVRLLWGRLLVTKGEPHGAIGTLRPLVAGGAPEGIELDARRTMAEAHTLLGESEKAVELLEGRLGGDPAIALQLGRAQYRAGAVDQAVETLRPFAERLTAGGGATGLPPSLGASIAAEYGRQLVAVSRFEEAIPYLEMATKAQPGRKDAWQSLGQALAAVGKVTEAQEALERFQSLAHAEMPDSIADAALEEGVADPTGREVKRAVELISQDRAEEALVVLRQEIALAPDDIRPRLMESRALIVLGRMEDALESAQETVELAPESADAHYQRGAAHAALNQIEEAERDFRHALELSPRHTAAMSDLAVILATQGERDEAAELLRRVLELQPDNPIARRHLESIEQSIE